MRKIGVGLILLIVTLTIAGCGVSQNEYDTSVSNLAQAERELDATQAQLARAEQELETPQVQLNNIAGTAWSCEESDGDHYEFYFMSDGSLHYNSPTGYWTVATWRQDGNEIYMEFNDKYAERQGTITGNRMEGDAWNIAGKNWTWSAER